MPRRPVDALVFSGGGARGAYQIGVYEALREAGLEPDLVTGTSVGAILATLVASGCRPQQMKELWLEACERSLSPYRRDVWRVHRWSHVRENDRLGELLARAIHWPTVRTSSIELRFTAVDVCDGDRVLFDNETATPEALLASTAIPILFPVQEVDGRPLWDGGLLTATPLQPAIEAGAEEIYAILNEPVNRPATEPPASLPEALDRVIDIVNERALRKDLRRAREINELVREGNAAPYWHLIHFHLFAPEQRLDVNVLDLDAEEARELWARGYEDTQAYFEGRHADQEALERFGPEEDLQAADDEGSTTLD